MDWIAGIREQAEIAKRVAGDISAALAAPTITADQASRLHHIVAKRAVTFDQFFVEMQRDESVTAALVDAGDSLANIWSNLSTACAKKVRTLQEVPTKEGGNGAGNH